MAKNNTTPVANTSPAHEQVKGAEVIDTTTTTTGAAVASVPADMKSKLAALQAGVQAEAQQQQQAEAPAKAQRTASTTRKITSTPSVAPDGTNLQRRNSQVPTRQVVAIVSESAKLAHITTDINYAVLTQAAAVNKANKELIKQQQIKVICNQPDLKVLVTQQFWSIDQQPGDTIPMQQRAKAEVYGYFASRGFTMLGNIRRNSPSAESQPVGEITFIEVGAVDVNAAPVVIGSSAVAEGINTYKQNAQLQAQADAAAKAAAAAAKKKAPQAAVQTAPVEEGATAVDLKAALLATNTEVKTDVVDTTAADEQQKEVTGENENTETNTAGDEVVE